MKNFRFLGGLAALQSLAGTVRADIPPPPPPPPTIPGTSVTVPGATPIVLVGVLLSLAIVLIGLALLRKRPEMGKLARTWVLVPATVVSIATASLAVWAGTEHAAHTAKAAKIRANWRPNGPVPRRVNVPARPPANDPPVETSPSTAPDPIGTAR